jgi:hypothetical protein
MWLWHSYVSKPHSACRNHSYCDEHTHECNFWTQSVISTRTSVIYLRRVWLPHAECDFYPQSVISKRSVILTRTNVITTLTTVSTSHSACWNHSCKCRNHICACQNHTAFGNYILLEAITRCVWKSHSTYTLCVKKLHSCVCLSQYAWKSDFYTQSVMTRMSARLTKVIMTLIRVKTTLCVYKSLFCVMFTRILSWTPARMYFLNAKCDFNTR